MFVSVSLNEAPVSGIELAFDNVKVIVELAFATIDTGENALAIDAAAAVTVTQLAASDAVLTFDVRLMFPLLLVNAAGLDAQLALTWPGTLVICTSIVQDVCAAGIVAPVTVTLLAPAVAVVTDAADVQVELPRIDAAPIFKPLGKVSLKLIPLCAGFVPVLVSVNRSTVLPPSTKVPGVNVLVSTGGTVLTTRQRLATPLVTFATPEMLELLLVNAAGLALQSLLTCAVRLVTELIVMVQDAVDALIDTPLRLMVSGDPCTTLLEPAQPAPNATVGVALVNLSDAGSESVKAMPLCAGLVPELVNVKTRSVLAPSLMVLVDQAFVNVGLSCVTTRH
jgi:hypothetical protein